ncbi:MAG: hypothetical protein WD018_04645 [Nitrosopumilaceae archaeon]
MIIQNQNIRRNILSALSDEHMSKILESTSVCEKTVFEIMQEQSMPHSTAYRKIKQLLKYGLLALYRSKITDGKKVAFYKSTFRSIQINYSGSSEYKIEATSNSDVLEKISKRFYDFDED